MTVPALYFPVSSFLASVQKTLRDEFGYQYDPQTELLPLLNDATAEICNRDPQAVVSNIAFPVAAFSIKIALPGSGYAVGDTITLAGGVYASPIVLVVAGVSLTGGLDMVAVQATGSYSAYPSNPVQPATTSGLGSGAAFTLLRVGPRQEVPPDFASLIEVKRNLGPDGQTAGHIIKKAATDDMDAARPFWPQDVAGVNGQRPYPVHYMSDDRDPRRFYLWPCPNTMATSWYVEIVGRSIPNNVGLTDAFPLPSLYEAAAKYYVIAHVLLRLDADDKRYKKGMELSVIYMKLFEESVQSSEGATMSTVPSDKVNKP